MDRGKSLLIISDSTGTGWITAQMPSTHKRLKMLDPTTLLRAISLEPQRAAKVLTANSGALVPKATMVSPIISPGTLKFLAREELPSTNQSAPFIKAANPITSNKTLNNNILLHSPFFKIYFKYKKSEAFTAKTAIKVSLLIICSGETSSRTDETYYMGNHVSYSLIFIMSLLLKGRNCKRQR